MNPYFPKVLQEYLRECLRELPLPAPEDVGLSSQTSFRLRSAEVFIGDFPAGQTTPCVLILPLSGWQENGEAVVRVRLLCCVYNAEWAARLLPESESGELGDMEGGEMDLALLLSAVSQALMPCAGQPLQRLFRLSSESRRGRLLYWEKSENQAQPYMQAVLMTHWRMKGLE